MVYPCGKVSISNPSTQALTTPTVTNEPTVIPTICPLRLLRFKLVRKYRGKIDGGTEWFAFDWWAVPYTKTCLLGKCWAVNGCYVTFAMVLTGLIVVILVELI